jgi:hypothetical protein
VESQKGEAVDLFVGDDWAEEHHDVELMDAAGRRLARARLPEGMAGMAQLHAMIGKQLGDDADVAAVKEAAPRRPPLNPGSRERLS